VSAPPAKPEAARPAPEPAPPTDQPAASAPKPATLAEVRQAIDWLAFPKPPGAQWEETDLLKTDHWALGTLDQAVDFYRKALTAAGWSEEKMAHPDTQPDKYRSLEFTKNGFLVALFLEGKAQSVKVHLDNRGNVDARRLPKPPGATEAAGSRSMVTLTTPSKPEAVADFCRKELTDLGWRETPERGSRSEESVSLRFVQNAMECQVVILQDKSGSTKFVTYHTNVRREFEPADVAAHFAPQAIPKPASAQEVLQVLDLRQLPRLGEGDFQVNTGLRAGYETRASVARAVAFYRKALAERGWALVPPLVDVDEDGRLQFEKSGFHVSVEIKNLIDEPNKTGLVRIVLAHHGNVDLRQLPYPPGAEIGYLRQLNFQFTTSASEQEVAAFYRRELAKLGWKEVPGVHPAFVQNDVRLTAFIHTTRAGRTPVQLSVTFAGER
jgi:hypothetical protein